MKITVIGSGYVGLVTGACFAEMGNEVTCVDIDKNRVENLQNGIIPIHEPGLESLILKNVENKNIFFTTSLPEAVKSTEIVFIAVGTPMNEDGSADLQHVLAVAKELGKNVEHSILVVNKSTVPVGTAAKVKKVIQEEFKNRNLSIDFDVVSNPEFLKEGAAINDFMKPDRVVIGSDSEAVIKKMKQLYSPFFRTHDRFLTMDIKSAEMTKYAANAMLATKISFMNEMANICERVGADVNQVRLGIGSDSRIGYSFIYPGIGYGGACFPKDIKALKKVAEDYGYEAQLINAVENINNRQKTVLVDKIVKRFGEDLEGLTFAMWGLSFKPGTDDMREAPSVHVIKELVKRKAKIKAYDPKAMIGAKEFYLKDVDGVEYCKSKYEVLPDSNALLLMTEWKEFRSPDFEEIKKQLIDPVIFDGRNQYYAFNIEEIGFEYFQIGK